MAVTPLPALDRTSASFKTDVDAFFATKLPTFSVEVNQVAVDAQAAASSATASKNAASASAGNAATSESNAATSRNQASTFASNASTSASQAATSRTNAGTSETNAAQSATNSANSATAAAQSAAAAKASADSIGSGPVTSVNTKTGVVTLGKADIGLSLVDNLSVFARGMSASPAVLTTIANIDEYLTLTNGWYAVAPTSTGVKPAGETWGTLIVAGRAFQSDARVNQFFFSEAGGSAKVFVRSNIGGSWTPWLELTRPSKSAMKRRPLTPSEDTLTEVWSHILSIPLYLDKSLTTTAAASQVMDVSSYSVYDFLLAATTTFSFANLPSLAGETLTVIVRIRQDATTPRSISWPSNITWLTPQSIAPQTPTVGQIVEYIFSTVGSPANWYGRVGAST